jgi:hypothetical protein
MSMPNRTILGFLGVISLALVGAGTLVFLNRDTVFKNLIEAWDTQGEKTEATLFRWGEVMSISAELKAQYGAEPEVTYDTSTSVRTLSICFSNYQLPEQVTTEGHAREIAAFAIGKTTKFEQIDLVKVLFQNPSGKENVQATDGSGSYTFALGELMPSQPQDSERKTRSARTKG